MTLLLLSSSSEVKVRGAIQFFISLYVTHYIKTRNMSVTLKIEIVKLKYRPFECKTQIKRESVFPNWKINHCLLMLLLSLTFYHI